MSGKLPIEHAFYDFSDYGRGIARFLVKYVFYPLNMGAISITWLFFLIGCIAIYGVYSGQSLLVLFLLPVKSIIDAADGEMARYRNKPSYVGRYLDSNLDLLLNLGLFLALYFRGDLSLLVALLAWLSWQIQGTFYNYYYVARRSQFNGDITSKSNESTCPTPYPYESAWAVRFLHRLYLILYGWQDAFARLIDPNAVRVILPKWMMTLFSVFGLGFQLLLFGVLFAFFPINMLLMYVLGFSNILLIALIGLSYTLRLKRTE